jgi:protein gp37
MGDKSAIQWTDATWNPVTGCSKVSPGCAHCYAETLTARYAGSKGWIEEHRPWTPENAEHNVRLHPERLDQPLRWRRPRMVFVNSMSDLFHELVPDEFIAQVFDTMRLAREHTFQILTKRPERMREVCERLEDPLWVDIAEKMPLPNVWLGTSIENRRYVSRADELRATPAAVRFVSAEPLLGPLVKPFNNADLMARLQASLDPGPYLDLTDIDWLIVGGESGPGHRPMEVEWVRSLRDVCGAQAGPDLYDHPHTAFFFKQWGGVTPKSGGRLLDGRTWDEIPVPAIPTKRSV